MAYAYALKFAVSIQDSEASWAKSIKNVHEGCLFGCPKGTASMTCGRGLNYYIGANDPAKNEQLKNCLATFWSGTHFMLYTMLGLFCPDLFWHTFAVGVLFEGYEKTEYDCADPLDVLFNSTGFMIGYTINNFML